MTSRLAALLAPACLLALAAPLPAKDRAAADIPAKLGGMAEAGRKQWERTRDRVVQEAGLEM